MTLRHGDFGAVQLWWDAAALATVEPALFEPAGWPERVGSGRGAALGRSFGGLQLVLRHYRRGGLPARISADRYLFTGVARTRPWRELELTARLRAQGLPVPRPVAARVVRTGPFYQGDLITERIAATPFAELAGAARPGLWQAVGACIARFHAAGLDHADLNARNLLVDAAGTVWLIDLDRGRLRPPGGWRRRNLSRLRRSLEKLRIFSAEGWSALMRGYGNGR